MLSPGAGSSSDADRSGGARSGQGDAARESVVLEADAPEAVAPEPRGDPPVRVVIIDAGHGGVDPGTASGGLREKDLALSLAKALEEEMVSLPNTEVYLTRERDVLVPIWERGERATEWRGDRPGVFISLHLNALPSSRSTRGFETYFLSEARTDHERRVSALENASLELEGGAGGSVGEEDLSFILSELRNLDHQNWSAHLAERIQEEMDGVHPGPNRGVKQGPFAVITNTLMPAVLVEVGFLTNRSEAQLMARADFQRDAARAIARAVDAFFQSYPPAQVGGGQGS
jgi:N-acetylmuramoyl-L-alanine amidase